jgi:hypothetical protein
MTVIPRTAIEAMIRTVLDGYGVSERFEIATLLRALMAEREWLPMDSAPQSLHEHFMAWDGKEVSAVYRIDCDDPGEWFRDDSGVRFQKGNYLLWKHYPFPPEPQIKAD